MSDMPDVVHVEGDESYGSYYGSDQGDTTPYIRADLVPSWNRDMSAAPKDGSQVMIAAKGEYVCVTRTPLGEWHSDADGPYRFSRHTPIAWMSLPKHPDDEATNG